MSRDGVIRHHLDQLTEAELPRSNPVQRQRPEASGGCPNSETADALERVIVRGDRVTALTEDICCEKIRGCSYKGGNTLTMAATNKCSDSRQPAKPWRGISCTHSA